MNNIIDNISNRIQFLRSMVIHIDSLLLGLNGEITIYDDLCDEVRKALEYDRYIGVYFSHALNLCRVTEHTIILENEFFDDDDDDDNNVVPDEVREEFKMVSAQLNARFEQLETIAEQCFVIVEKPRIKEALLFVLAQHYYAVCPRGVPECYLLITAFFYVRRKCEELWGNSDTIMSISIMDVHQYVLDEEHRKRCVVSGFEEIGYIFEGLIPIVETHFQEQRKKRENLLLLQSRVEAIEHVFHRRSVFLGDEEGKPIKCTVGDLKELQLLLTNIDEDQKKLLLDMYSGCSNNSYFLHQALSMEAPMADYSKPRQRNTPFSQLLADFENKKSKRVGRSRKELLSRYEYLDSKQQLAIRIAMMNSCAKTDQLTGCRLAMERWNGKELPLVKQLWSKWIEDPEDGEILLWIGRLLLRHASLGFLKQNESYFQIKDWGLGYSTLYYYYCLRMVGEPGFEVNKSILSLAHYYRLVYYKHLPFDEAMWREDFYAAAAELSGCFDDCLKLTTREENFYPRVTYFDKQCEFQRITDVDTMHDMLLFGSLMGASILEFIDYANRVEALQEEMLNKPTNQSQILYVRALAECAPEEYKHLFKINFDDANKKDTDEFPIVEHHFDVLPDEKPF